MAGAHVVPLLGVDWVGNGGLFLSFRCQPGGHQAKGAGVGLVARSLEELVVHLLLDTFLLFYGLLVFCIYSL